ncbi:MAG: class I SAM-dependent methyltransferase [Bacteroidales bacterium]|nr:class I SAM-dependent methyltransferase [Bacteroidales bacterium]
MIFEYFKYLIFSKKNVNGIHSTYLSNFAIKVLNNFKNINNFIEIENIRKKLLRNHQIIKVVDLGAGTKKKQGDTRIVSKIAKHSLTKPKYCRLLFSIANFTKAQTILELGTSLGITTLYFAKAEYVKKIVTLEGDNSIYKLANDIFKQEGSNISHFNINFDDYLVEIKNHDEKYDLIFIDGNHTKEATLRYFNILKEHISSNGVIIFDDIRWSKGMFEAWNKIKDTNNFSTVDLFKFGIVFFDKTIVEKQNLQLFF